MLFAPRLSYETDKFISPESRQPKQPQGWTGSPVSRRATFFYIMKVEEPEENYQTGWIRIYRSILNHPTWKEKPYSKGQAWIWIILRANFKEAKVLIGNEVVVCDPGEFITSQDNMAEVWGWTLSRVRAFISLLQNDSMIIEKTTNRFTKLTICNYATYQGGTTNQTANDQPTDGQRTAIDKKYKKLRSKESTTISSKKSLFKENEMFDKGKFAAALPDWERHVLRHYYEAMDRWSSENGNKKVDWIATAKNWRRRDEGKGFFPPKDGGVNIPKDKLRGYSIEQIRGMKVKPEDYSWMINVARPLFIMEEDQGIPVDYDKL